MVATVVPRLRRRRRKCCVSRLNRRIVRLPGCGAVVCSSLAQVLPPLPPVPFTVAPRPSLSPHVVISPPLGGERYTHGGMADRLQTLTFWIPSFCLETRGFPEIQVINAGMQQGFKSKFHS